MKTVFFLIPDDLHEKWRIYLIKNKMTGKEAFLTFVQRLVKEGPNGKKSKVKDKQDSGKT